MSTLLSEELVSLELLLARSAPCVGRVVALSPTGQAMVDFPGNAGGAVVARSIVTLQHTSMSVPIPLPQVLLVFDENDISRPVIVGIVRDAFINQAPAVAETVTQQTRSQQPADDRVRTFVAKDRLEFRCGKSSIELRNDGKVLIRGTQIVSRASRTNRIKGGSVAIN